MRNRLRIVAALAGCTLAASAAHGANVEVPSLELYTKGSLSGGTVDLQTEGETDLTVEGGVKFGASITLGFSSPSLEDDFTARLYQGSSAGSALTFSAASVVIRDLFDVPLDFTYFVGQSDEFAGGAAFPEVFGSEPIATNYRGFLYFPDSDHRYEGIHSAAGTGIRLALGPLSDRLYTAVYFYQDGHFRSGAGTGLDPYIFEAGRYSADAHLLLDLGKIKLESFLGGSFPVSDWGVYRGGLLFHAADVGGEFLAQIGVPYWDPMHSTADIDLFFLLFEARLHLGLVTLIPTVFLHPGTYAQQPSGEAGLLDFNLNLRIGDFQKALLAGGVETNLAFEEEDLQGLRIKLGPYFTFATPGVLWLLKIDTTVFPSLEFEGFVGIKAEF